jgi:hypothetical protein
MLEHYVIFKPQPGRDADLLSALQQFGEGVTRGLPCLLELTWGANTNPSGIQRGYTHSCLARLISAESLKTQYWVHPAHQRLLAQLDELCEDRFAMDYLADVVVTGVGGEHDA